MMIKPRCGPRIIPSDNFSLVTLLTLLAGFGGCGGDMISPFWMNDGIAVADFNGDGLADLAVALQNTAGGAAVLLQNPAIPISFRSPIHLSNGSGALSVAVGDLNHDGRPDIAVDGRNTVHVFFQDSTGGTFGLAVPIAAGNRPTSGRQSPSWC